MGYVTAGYPSRPHKRVEKQEKRIYYDRKRLRINEIDERRDLQLRDRQRGPASLQLLPADVLERIFVLAGRGNSMPVLNRYFQRCLRPTRYLMGRFLLENYTHDLNALLPRGSPALLVLLDATFCNGTLLQFLNENPQFLDHVHDVVVPADQADELSRERRVMLEQGRLDDITALNWQVEMHPESNKPLREFPAAFYQRPALFFENEISKRPVTYNQLFLRLQSTYAIQQPAWVCDLLIEWFFLENESFDINHLFHAVNLVLHLSVNDRPRFEDVSPLTKFITYMYLDVTDRLLQLLLCENLEDVGLICERKAKIVDKFIRKFYRGSVDLLSSDELWKTVHEVRDRRLVESISNYGGKPSFNIVK
ncbi:LAQU0S16e00980g1_1 [Lachancea quebecensis]|uniref:LAQU0S16e00980g1_1 n=1 Tax=Lachancea quebecensis TaxID=1654605 RepID=A0A0P1KW41_9SACH|nr:LAQU0S16e00980g1_1 [Lachancea quebecensis]